MTGTYKLTYPGAIVNTLLRVLYTIENARENTGAKILLDDLSWSNTLDGGSP